MPYISSYDVIRVIRLNEPNRHFDGTEGASRPPQIGDIGEIVYDNGGAFFQVESVNSDSLTVWLAEFHVSEVKRLYGEPVEWDQLPIAVSELTNQLRIGMTRQEVLAVLGEPDDMAVCSERETPLIFKYGEIELHFEQPANGALRFVSMEHERLGIMLLD